MAKWARPNILVSSIASTIGPPPVPHTQSTTNSEMPTAPESSKSAISALARQAHIAITRCSKRLTRSAMTPKASREPIPSAAVAETISAAVPRGTPSDT